MSKINTHTDQILLKAMKLLTPHEFVVFTAWYTDKLSWNAPQSEIVERTKFSQTDVSKRFKGIIGKGILEVSSKAGRSIDYRMKDSFLESILNEQPLPTLGPVEESILDNPDNNSKETNMTNEDKIYLTIKNENKDVWLSQDFPGELISALVGANTSEEIVEAYGKRYLKEASTFINSLKKPSAQRESWILNLKDSFDKALVEFFPPPEVVKAVSQADKDNTEPTTPGQYGMMSAKEYKLQRAHADSFPELDWTKIHREVLTEEEVKELEVALRPKHDSDFDCEVDL
jgi:hypothetical protein